jgi:hypothetical protein
MNFIQLLKDLWSLLQAFWKVDKDLNPKPAPDNSGVFQTPKVDKDGFPHVDNPSGAIGGE